MFFIPESDTGTQVEVFKDGVQITAQVDGPWVRVPAGAGAYELISR